MCRNCEAVMVSSLDRLGASPTEKKGASFAERKHFYASDLGFYTLNLKSVIKSLAW